MTTPIHPRDTNLDAQPDATKAKQLRNALWDILYWDQENVIPDELAQAGKDALDAYDAQPDAAPDNKKEVFRVFWTDAKHPEPTMVLLRFRSEFRAKLCAENIATASPGVKVWVEKETAPDKEQEADNVL